MAEPEDKAKQNQTDGSDPVSPAPTTPAESFLARMTIAGCLLGKEIYRNKLKWFDLRRADLRLGEKAYQTRAFSGQTQLVSQLDQLRDEEAKLRQRDDRATSTFSERLKVLIRVAIGAVQAAVLQVKRQRLLAQLGGMIRRDNSVAAPSLSLDGRSCTPAARSPSNQPRAGRPSIPPAR